MSDSRRKPGSGTTEKELKGKTSTLAEDLSSLLRGSWTVFACCAAQDPESREESARRGTVVTPSWPLRAAQHALLPQRFTAQHDAQR